MSLMTGRTMPLWFILVSIAVGIYAISLGKKGYKNLRQPAGLGAIEEAIGRAVEMGKPIHFAPGSQPMIGARAVQVAAGLTLLGYVAERAARMGARLICSLRYPELLPMAQDIIQSAYRSADRADLYSDNDTVRYLSTQQMAFASGVIGLVQRERVAANFLLGPFTGDTLLLAEAASQVGAIQVGGMSELGNIPFMIATCDYVMIGEEFFVASAIAGANANQLASIRGQDLIKAGIVVVILAGVILKAAGVLDLAKILKT